VSRVRITSHDIDSVFGLCTILTRKREGATFAVHVECKDPNGNQMLGDINFTPREDKTVDFSDRIRPIKPRFTSARIEQSMRSLDIIISFALVSSRRESSTYLKSLGTP
jgi:hypothetical protein